MESHSETPAVWVRRPGASWRVQTPGASVPERLPEPAAVGGAGPAWPVELGFQGQHVLPLLLHVPWMLGPPLSTKDTHAPPRSVWTSWVSHTRQALWPLQHPPGLGLFACVRPSEKSRERGTSLRHAQQLLDREDRGLGSPRRTGSGV